MSTLLLHAVLWIQSTTAQSNAKFKYSGMTFTDERYCLNISMDSSVGLDSMRHLATTGANYVAIVVTQYQSNISSTDIFPIFDEPVECTATPSGFCVTATDASLINTIGNAHSLGLQVLLKPHIDLIGDAPHWRGQIGMGMTQAQWTQWFASYEQYIVRYAQLAEQNGVAMLSVSTELIEASTQESFWRDLIPKIRGVYSGVLTDAANWSRPGSNTGELAMKQWWDLVDVIGCDEYFVSQTYRMINGSYPSLAQLLGIWEAVEQQMLALHVKWNKSVVFTEIGYCSGVNGTCYANGGTPPGPPTNDSLFAMYTQYEACLMAMSKYDWFEGVFWWNWDSDAAFGGETNSCMDPKYKPVEGLLRQWYHATEPQPPPPAYTATCECWL